MANSINIQFPFAETQEGGVFAVNKITENAYADDLVALFKNLLTFVKHYGRLIIC